MRLLINILLLFIFSTPAWSATWYIRSDGGTYGTTSTTCNGLYNVAYSAGNGPNCAVSSVYQIWQYVTDDSTGRGGTTRFSGGDTVYFSKSGDSFPIGADRSVTPSGCSSLYSFGCYLTPPPSGSAGNPTRIVGYGYDSGCAGTKIQLYGVQGVKYMFQLNSVNYVNFECLEITDHSNCAFRIGNNVCNESYGSDIGNYARTAFRAYGGSNFIFKNIDEHGMSDRGFLMGGQTNITMSYVNMDGNYGAGWDGDVGHTGSESYISGNINADHIKVRFNGCQEAYPRSGTFSTADYTNCVDQNYPGTPGYGDGWGFYTTGGNWNIRNSEFSHNLSDGLDLLYGDGTTNLFVDKSLFEGNTGNQLKLKGLHLKVTNSVLIANCEYLTQAGKAVTGGIVDCRANGTPFSIISMAGSTVQLYNNTVVSSPSSGGSAFAEWDYNGTCNGTETYNIYNNIGYSPNATWVAFYSGMSGSCQTAFNSRIMRYNNFYNFQDNPTGTGNVYTNPSFLSALNYTADSNLSNVYLTISSPGKGIGANGLSYWNTSNDYNNYPQNSPIDAGSLQYNSVQTCFADSLYCGANTDCCSGYCSSLNLCYTPGSYLYNITPIGSIKFQ